MDPRAFSVVVCTYRRPARLRRAMASVCAQAYPADRYELIVVDNAADEATARVVAAATADAPIPVAYVREARNGVSAARNRGIAAARFEYVAFLDDDAVADPGWLAAFDRVIREHHAMVVGGRTIPVLAAGATPPPWFSTPIVQGLFGASARTRGRAAAERMRFPDNALGGGNCVYARRLFQHFGGFPVAHGRTARSLRAGEESYLNLLLDRHDIPIYLTDLARIEHVVDVDRLTPGHLRRRSFWNNVSGAEIHTQFFGRAMLYRLGWPRARHLARLLWAWLRGRDRTDRLTRECLVCGHLGFLAGLVLGAVRNDRVDAGAVSWGVREWIAEARSWPDGLEKERRLYDLFTDLGDEPAARAALDRMLTYLVEPTPRTDHTPT